MDLLTKFKPDEEFFQGVYKCEPYVGDLSNVTLLMNDDGSRGMVHEVFQILNDVVGQTVLDPYHMERIITKECKLYLSYEGCYGKVITGLELTPRGLNFKVERDIFN
jgi:hypothetical protein